MVLFFYPHPVSLVYSSCQLERLFLDAEFSWVFTTVEVSVGVCDGAFLSDLSCKRGHSVWMNILGEIPRYFWMSFWLCFCFILSDVSWL